MSEAILRDADLRDAHLPEATLLKADLGGARLGNAELWSANLSQANLDGSHLSGASLGGANLNSASLIEANLKGAWLHSARIEKATMQRADLSEAKFTDANLTGAVLSSARLIGADLTGAALTGAVFDDADLSACNFAGAIVTSVEALKDCLLEMGTRLDDVHWGGVAPRRLRRRRIAESDSTSKRAEHVRSFNHEAIVRRQLAGKMSDLGLLASASRYRLEEQKMRRKEFFWRGKIGAWLFSWILYLVSGYGEKPLRALLWYLAAVTGFAGIYYSLTNYVTSQSGRLTWYEAAVLSLSSFHGRGFIPATVHLGDPLAGIAAVEAIIGLFIELIFIATFTRRFLGN